MYNDNILVSYLFYLSNTYDFEERGVMGTRDGETARAGAAARVSLDQKAIRSMHSTRCIRTRVPPANESDQIYMRFSVLHIKGFI